MNAQESAVGSIGIGGAPPRVESCRFGLVVIDGQRYTRDVLIFPDRVIADWWREQGHALAVADLHPLLEHMPQVLVVGLGHVSRMQVLPETSEWLRRLGVRLIAASTPEACEDYNRLRLEQRAAAALHLTC